MRKWAVAAALLLAFAAGVASVIAGGVDSAGVGGNHHGGPVPTGVRRITARAYVVAPPASTSGWIEWSGPPPEAICLSDGEEHGAVQEAAPMPGGGTFVLCNVPQSWNSRHAPRPNFGGAVVRFWEGAASWIFGIVALVAFGIVALVAAAEAVPRLRRERAQRRRAALQFDELQAGLGAAYARGEIDMPTYERKVAELLEHR